MTTAAKARQKDRTVLWWIGWITLTIVSFFLSCWFWTGIIARHAGSMDKPGVPLIWICAVFGTWMVLLVPLIVVMYNKVDRSYEDARYRREEQTKKMLASQFNVPVLVVERSRRLLPAQLRQKLRRLPKTLKQGQLVHLDFPGGQRLENAFVWEGEEVIGVYGRADYPFDAQKALSAALVDAAESQPVEYSRWLRLEDPAEAGA